MGKSLYKRKCKGGSIVSQKNLWEGDIAIITLCETVFTCLLTGRLMDDDPYSLWDNDDDDDNNTNNIY